MHAVPPSSFRFFQFFQFYFNIVYFVIQKENGKNIVNLMKKAARVKKYCLFAVCASHKQMNIRNFFSSTFISNIVLLSLSRWHEIKINWIFQKFFFEKPRHTLAHIFEKSKTLLFCLVRYIFIIVNFYFIILDVFFVLQSKLRVEQHVFNCTV